MNIFIRLIHPLCDRIKEWNKRRLGIETEDVIRAFESTVIG